MKGLRVYIKALEPLIISNGTTEGMAHKTLEYVPGNMLLGALASRWKMMHPGLIPDDSAEFNAIFIDGCVSFGHAVPNCAGRPASPTPLSFQYNKHGSSLPSLEEEEKNDCLVVNQLKKPAEPRPVSSDEKPAKFKSLSSAFLDVTSKHIPKVSRIQTMHVAIGAKERKAEDSRLFGYAAIASGIEFCTTIYCAEEYFEPLKQLLEKGSYLQLGHSRSAGYGTVQVMDLQDCPAPQGFTVSPLVEHTLYLESAFFPEKSWQSPREGLLACLDKYLGSVQLLDEKVYARPLRLEAFNSFWHLPRATRIGFLQGSIFTFSSKDGGTLPWAIGKSQVEGYGRIVLDPAFLNDYQIRPSAVSLSSSKATEKSASTSNSIMLNLWRRRTLARLAAEEAIDCVWSSEVFDNFINSLISGTQPSQSQRGNIRQMLLSLPKEQWATSFAEILEKQPGRQWKSAVAKDPFQQDKNREMLDKIILNLLDQAKTDQCIQKSIQWSDPILPGGDLSAAERELFLSERHKRLLLELLRRWEEEYRGRGEKK